MRSSVDSRFSDNARKIFSNLKLICRSVHFENMPVENFLTVDKRLINPHLQNGLSFKVSSVAHCNIMPVAACLIKQIMDVFNSIVEIDSQKSI